MTVAEQAQRRVYKLDEIAAIFAANDSLTEFGFSDLAGFQSNFIEVQVWDHSAILNARREWFRPRLTS